MQKRNIIAIPPGETIKEQLSERKISQQEFAFCMEMSEEQVRQLLNGEILLTSEVAARLESVLGLPARFWMNLESIYREKIEKIKMSDIV